MTMELTAEWRTQQDSLPDSRPSTSALGLAPVPAGYHRWPEDDTPAPVKVYPTWVALALLYRFGHGRW